MRLACDRHSRGNFIDEQTTLCACATETVAPLSSRFRAAAGGPSMVGAPPLTHLRGVLAKPETRNAEAGAAIVSSRKRRVAAEEWVMPEDEPSQASKRAAARGAKERGAQSSRL